MKKKNLLLATLVLCVLGVMAQSTEPPPDGYVDIYSLPYVSASHVQTDQGGAVDAVASKQLVGPSSGWGDGTHYYEVANYDSLAIKVTFDLEDAGKQVAFRIGFDGTVTPYIITYPTDGSTTYIHRVSLAGKKRMYGLLFYNGVVSSWGQYTYTGTPAAKAATIDYLALKEVIATGLAIVPADTVAAKALPLGLSTTLKPAFTPANATYNGVTWESLNTDIATVDANGVVTAGVVTAGTATIKVASVTYPALTGTYDVVVVASITPVESVEMAKDSASVKLLNSLTLSANVLPSNATDRNVTWSSSDTTVAKVDATGKVTPIKGGITNIVITTADGDFKDTCVVTVVGFRDIPAGYTSLYTFSYNDAGTLKPLATNTDGLGANLPAIVSSNANSLLGPGADWNRANKHVDLMGYSEVQVACTFKPEDVGKKFQFRYAFSKAAGEGTEGSVITNRTVTITAQDMFLTIDLNNDPADVDNIKRVGAIKFRNDVDGEIRFNVDYIAVKTAQLASITLSKKALALEIGKVDTLTYTLFPMDAVNKDVVWTSSDTNIVTVKDGALSTAGLGQAVIKLTAVADSTVLDSCVVTVNPFPAGFVNLYSLNYISPSFTQTDQAGAVDAVASKQLVGPSSGWGDGVHYYEVANYDSLFIKVSFDSADAGKQVAFRIGFDGTVTPYIITYPTDGSTTYIHRVSLAGKKRMYGLLFYNGVVSSWGQYTYTGTPAAKAATIDYLALKEVIATGLTIVPADTVAAKALPLGLSTTLKAVFTPVNATYNSVVWESLNPTIATVDANGVVKADTLNTGTATIKVTSVTYPSFSATYNVVVVEGATPVSGVEVSKDSASVKLLNTFTLSATVLPSNATKRDITWFSSDTTVAKVDATGKVTPVKAGVAFIVVNTNDGNFKDSCVVTVNGFKPVPDGFVSLYSLNYNEAGTVKPLSQNLAGLGATLPAIFSSAGSSLLGTVADWNRANKHVDLKGYSEVQVACTFKPEDLGKKFQFRYAFSKAAGEGVEGSVITNRTVTITDTDMLLTIDLDNDTADVDNIKRLGAVKFRNDVDGEIRFNVDYIAAKVIPVTAIVLADASLELKTGESATLTYQVLPSTALEGNVTWTSSNEVVATVTNGLVNALTVGTTTIRATSVADVTLYDECVVTVVLPNALFKVQMSDPNALVNVYNVSGMLIRKDVKASEATIGLKEGLYLVGNRKVMVVR